MPSNEIAEKLLYDLVATASPSHEEEAASTLLVEWMTANGFDSAFRDKVGNAVGIKGKGKREIILLGHIDTFPGEPPVKIEGRLLYGRGSVDAKGPLCTFASAAADVEVPPDWKLIVIGAVEEEAATSKGARHAITQYEPDLCVIGEPSNWDRITLGYKGRLLLNWEIEEPMAHSAAAIASPAEKAVDYWLRVKAFADKFNEGREGLFSTLDVSIRDINTFLEDVNGVAEMVLGFRLPPDLTPEQVVAALQPEAPAFIQTYGSEYTYVADKDSVLARAFRGGIRAQGGKPRFVYKTGTADMNVVGPVWNCPIVAYGPGDSNLDHTPHEHIDLDEYLRAIEVLKVVLSRLLN